MAGFCAVTMTPKRARKPLEADAQMHFALAGEAHLAGIRHPA